MRLLRISLLLYGLLVPACSTEPVPTDPLGEALGIGGILGLVTGDGAPVAGVAVTLSRSGSEVATVMTTGNGEFGFRGIDAGMYTVAISQIPGMSCRRLLVATVEAGEETAVSFACVTPSAIASAGTLQGRVTVNGVSAGRVLVSVGDASRSFGWTLTAKDGTYRIPDVPTGTRRVWIVTEEPCSGTRQENTTRALDIAVPEGGVAVADFACTGQAIKGRVTVDGISVSGLTVHLCYGLPLWDYGCVGPGQATDSEGRFAYTSLGTYRHSFWPGDYVVFVQDPPSGTTCPERVGIPVRFGAPVTADFACVMDDGFPDDGVPDDDPAGQTPWDY